MDVGEWLRSLGLEQYEAAFRDNEISDKVLASLTAEDLKDLGVKIVGHRRLLLDAIAALRDQASKAPPLSLAMIDGLAKHAGAASASPSAAPAPQEADGERRYLTALFCDLVGSTAIASQLDAEEWRDLVMAYLEVVSAAVAEMGGHMARRQGDGLMALFGYPVAYENDAERAVRAALAIQRALAAINTRNVSSGKPALLARVGLEAGPAVVDIAGDIYGGVANIAARVQELAEPGTVMITAQVQRQVAGLFVAEERGTHALKGVAEPTVLYRIVRASGAGRRAGQRQLTPLIGRDDEMATLMRRWDRARRGDGQFILIVGEPGIGKSRLIEEFHGRLGEVPHTWVEWTCSQLLQNTPMHPIAEWGRMRFGGAEVPAEQRFADLESSLVQVKLDPAEYAPLLAPMLDIPLPRERVPAMPPEELRRRQLAAVTNWAIAGARVQPVVLALEDAHWSDPSTLDVLRGIAERSAAPLFILVTARPEFRPPWSMRPHHATISLAPLDHHQVRHMVGELAARHALSSAVVEGVTERTGGVPLFVEEVTRLLLERGGQGGIRSIPPTLQQSLAARLDRLGSARELAQIGSVIGRGFSLALLCAIAGMEDATVQAALEKLAETDSLLVQGLPPDSDYRFKHALIQEAAYESLLKSRRQALHRRVAEILRDRFPDTAAAEPELLAHHFTQAGVIEAAIEWWDKAAQQSLQRSALNEAVAQFTRALDQIVTLPATPERLRQQIRLQIGLANALYHANGMVAAETKAAFDRARGLIERAQEIGEHLEDPLLLYSILYGFFIGKFITFDGDAARALATEFLTLAEQQTGTAPLMIGHRLLGNLLLCMGEPAGALSHLDRSLALYDPAAHGPLAMQFGHDVRAAIHAFRAMALWLLGYPASAQAENDRAVQAARDTNHVPTLLFTLACTTITELCCRDHARASAQAGECRPLASETGVVIWSAYADEQQGCVSLLSGKPSDAVSMISSGLAECRSIGATVWTTSWSADLAWAYAQLGQFDDAWRCIGEANHAIETAKEKWYEAEVSRLAGEITLRAVPQDVAKAEACFANALAVARQQQAKSWELRAAMSLARLWRDQGKPQQARELLAPVYGWFTEGFAMLDLQEARALLGSLA